MIYTFRINRTIEVADVAPLSGDYWQVYHDGALCGLIEVEKTATGRAIYWVNFAGAGELCEETQEYDSLILEYGSMEAAVHAIVTSHVVKREQPLLAMVQEKLENMRQRTQKS